MSKVRFEKLLLVDGIFHKTYSCDLEFSGDKHLEVKMKGNVMHYIAFRKFTVQISLFKAKRSSTAMKLEIILQSSFPWTVLENKEIFIIKDENSILMCTRNPGVKTWFITN